MLTPEQIQTIAKAQGDTNVDPSLGTPPGTQAGPTAPPTAQEMAAQYAKSVGYTPPGAAPAQTSPAPAPSSGGSFLSDVGKNLSDMVGGAASSIISPLVRTGGMIESGLDQTAGRVINAAEGKGFTPTNSGQQAQQAASDIQDAAPKSTAGSIGDVIGTIAPYFMGTGEGEAAAKAASLIPHMAQTAGESADTFIPKVISYLQGALPEVAKNTAIGTAQTGNLDQGVETGLGGEVIKGLTAPIKLISEAGYKGLSIPTSIREANMLQAYKANTPFSARFAAMLSGDSKAPITAADTAFRTGLWGTESGMGVQARKATTNLWGKVIGPALDNSEAKVDLPAFFNQARESIIKNTPELGDQASRLKALASVEDEYKGVSSIPLKELQDLKEGWASHVPQKAYRGEDITGAYNNVRNELSDLARSNIYSALGPKLRQAYIDYGNLKGIQKWGQVAMTGSKLKGGSGSFLSALKDAIVVPVATTAGQTVYKTANGLEFVGAPGAHYLSDIFTPNNATTPSQQQ